MLVKLNHTHNSAEALRHRDVGEEVVQTFKKLFEVCHSPSSALHVYKYDLEEEYGDDYNTISADRAVCPDLHWY